MQVVAVFLMIVMRNSRRFVSKESRQSLAKHQTGSEQADFDRPGADSQDIGRLLGRKFLDVA